MKKNLHKKLSNAVKKLFANISTEKENYQSIFYSMEDAIILFEKTSKVKDTNSLSQFLLKFFVDNESVCEENDVLFLQSTGIDEIPVKEEDSLLIKILLDDEKDSDYKRWGECADSFWESIFNVLRLILSEEFQNRERGFLRIYEHPLAALKKTIFNLPSHYKNIKWYLKLRQNFQYPLLHLPEKQLGIKGCFLLPERINIDKLLSTTKESLEAINKNTAQEVLGRQKEIKRFKEEQSRIEKKLIRSGSDFATNNELKEIKKEIDTEEIKRNIIQLDSERISRATKNAPGRALIINNLLHMNHVIYEEDGTHFYLLKDDKLKPINIFTMEEEDYITVLKISHNHKNGGIIILEDDIYDYIRKDTCIKGCEIERFPIKNIKYRSHKKFDILKLFIEKILSGKKSKISLSSAELSKIFPGEKEMSQQIGNEKGRGHFFKYMFENKGNSSMYLAENPLLILINRK